MTDALRNKPGELTWTPGMHKAFAALKHALVTPPVLAYPQVGERYWLECDGSKRGLGCVLSQMQKDGKLHPVAYGSRAVSRAEERYGATDLEACAVIFGLEHFDVYVRGHPLTVVTDHRALTHILRSNQKLSNDRQQRWRNRFMGQEIDVVYRAGRNHIVPDVLSRQIRTGTQPDPESTPLEEDRYEDLAWVSLSPTDQAQDGWEWLLNMQPDDGDSTDILQQKVRHEQRKDSFVHSLFSYAESGILPKDPIEAHWVKAFGWKCEVRDGMLYYALDPQKHEHVPVVPLHLRRDILHESHSAQTGGHFSAKRTTAHLKRRYWWPYMHQDIVQWVDGCMECAGRNGQGRFWAPPLRNLMVPERVHQLIALDLLRMPESERNHHYILVATDGLSRLARAVPFADKVCGGGS